MKTHQESIIVLAFWALYGPLAVIFWYETGARHYLDLVVIFLMGVLLVVKYLVISYVYWRMRRTRHRVCLKPEKTAREVPTTVDQEMVHPLAVEGFRKLFADNSVPKRTIDLD